MGKGSTRTGKAQKEEERRETACPEYVLEYMFIAVGTQIAAFACAQIISFEQLHNLHALSMLDLTSIN